MTITNEVAEVSFLGNGSTTVFPFTFLIPEDALQVYVQSGITETLIDPANYTVEGLGDPEGGSVTYNPSGTPLATGLRLIIRRALPYTQPLNIENQQRFYADVVMRGLDRVTMQVQQLAQAALRAIRVPIGDTPDVFVASLYTASATAQSAAASASADALAADQAKIVAQDAAVAAQAAPVPIGGAVLFTATGSLPAGYALANGGSQPRDSFRPLYALIGTSVGAGSGSPPVVARNENPNFTSDLSGWTTTGMVAWSADNSGSAVLSSNAGLRADFATISGGILELTTHFGGAVSPGYIVTLFRPDGSAFAVLPFLLSAGSRRIHINEACGAIELRSDGPTFSVSRLAVETGGTFAVPNYSEVASGGGRWIVRGR